MKLKVMATVMFATLALSGVASAQSETTNPHRGVITLPPKEITSPPMRPMASITIARIQPSVTLAEFSQTLIQRIEATIYQAGPF